MPMNQWSVILGLVFSSNLLASDVGMLTGCWKGSVHGAEIEERWGTSHGDLVLGTSKTTSQGAAVSFEFLKVSVTKKKTLYTPFIDGKEVASFTLDDAESSATKLVFENLANDFPKRVIYEQEKDALKISLTGDPSQNVDYVLKKIKCD